MRILIINSEYPPIGGGAANASSHVARALAASGHEITVLTSRYADLPEQELNDGVRIVRVPALRRKMEQSGALEQLSFILGGCFAGARLIRRFRPEATLAYFGMPGGLVALFAKMVFGVPYIVSLRGGDVPGFRPYDFALYHRMIGPLLRVIWRHAASVVANSNGLGDMAEAFYSRVPIRIIPNGVDSDRFAAVDRSWSPAKMLFVGRVVHQKGLDLLLEALGAARDQPWELSVVGDGPAIGSLQELAEQVSIGDRVHFLGWQRGDDLVRQYQAANLFVFPSRHEGMPNAVLEAMASGLPVIATRIAGSEELVVNEETGLLVDPEDARALGQALSILMPDHESRERMGAASRQRAESEYQWSQVANRYLELLSLAKERA